jgi:hypothetical protein
LPSTWNIYRNFFNWKGILYGEIGVSELRELRQLEEENAQTWKLVAVWSLEKGK